MNKAEVRWYTDALQANKAGVQDAVIHLRDFRDPVASADAMRRAARDLLALADRLCPPDPSPASTDPLPRPPTP